MTSPPPGPPEPAKPEPAKPEPTPEGSPGRDVGAIVRAVFTADNSALVTLLAILLALVVGAILMVVSDTAVMSKWNYFFQSPSDALSASWDQISAGYTALFRGSILWPKSLTGNSVTLVLTPITNTLARATPLIFGGLAVTLAFRAGLFNIGGQGQLIFGAILASWAGFAWHLPIVIHLIVALAAGMLGGLLYGAIPGWLKAYRGAHEVIVTIMLNYVALYFLQWLLNTTEFHDPTKPGQAISKEADGNAQLPHIFGGSLAPTLALPLALVAAFGVWWLLRRSTLGFEIRAVGLNPDAARTAGISVRRVQVIALSLSGLLFGLVGMYQVLAAPNSSTALTPNLDANLGFDAITVALLGRTSPWGVVWASLLWGALDAGSATMQTDAGIPVEIVEIIQALIVIFVAAPRLVKEIFRLREARHAPSGPDQAIASEAPVPRLPEGTL